jgi:hypothetical protein
MNLKDLKLGESVVAEKGPRGGNIIGHTKSGLPIYDSHGNANHKSFSKKDHQDATQEHLKKMGPIQHEMSQQHNGDGTFSKQHAKKKAQLQKQYEHHKLQRDRHANSADPKPREPDQKDFDRMDRQNDPNKRSKSWGK